MTAFGAFEVAQPMLLKKVIIALWIVALCWLMIVTSLSYYFNRTRPQVPDPGRGLTQRLDEHGCVVYLTTSERALMTSLDIVGGGALALVIVLAFYGFLTGRVEMAGKRLGSGRGRKRGH